VSLVDGAERALREWLAPGRHRPGDRLPPEHDLSAMLGVSRGTLRTALQRLEASGDIVRRQGSGTFVGNVASSAAFDEGLEQLESYTSLARRRGLKLSVRDLLIERRPIGAAAGRAFGLAPAVESTAISRLLLADAKPSALMLDVVRPGVPLPSASRLRRWLERGNMVLDALIAEGVPVAFARTHVRPRLVTPRDRAGRALGVRRTMAALELEELIHVTSGETVQHSTDLFVPGGIDVHVMRGLKPVRPGSLARQ
jgi:DNA-binding GntR family transcriptional regulator